MEDRREKGIADRHIKQERSVGRCCRRREETWVEKMQDACDRDTLAITGSVFEFFFQAEDGIRDIGVTGVQTCALPIWMHPAPCVRQSGEFKGRGAGPAGGGLSIHSAVQFHWFVKDAKSMTTAPGSWRMSMKIGRASCRERV